MSDQTRQTETLEELLACCGAQSLKRTGGSRWELAFSNGDSFAAAAGADEDWLALEVRPCGRRKKAEAGRLWDCLAANGALPGGAKFVLSPSGTLQIRADVPLEDGVCTPEAVQLAAVGLVAAVHRLSDKRAGEPDGEGSAAIAPDAAGPEDRGLDELCAAAGWKFTRRGSRELAVELPAAGAVAAAVVGPNGRGAVARLNLADCDGLGAQSREAIASALLSVGGLVRMARSGAVEAEDGTTLQYEAETTSHAAGQLDRALSALTVACRLCGPREIAAMQDERIAERYLAARGRSS